MTQTARQTLMNTKFILSCSFIFTIILTGQRITHIKTDQSKLEEIQKQSQTPGTNKHDGQTSRKKW